MAILEGELELELESEYEGDGEYETGLDGEEFLGTIARGIGGLLGEGEEEYEWEEESEWELEGEYEGEEFFKKLSRKVGGFVKKAAPVLRKVAKVAAPVVGTAVGGPLGGFLGKAASSVLEGEFEEEFEGELEEEFEGELEDEMSLAPVTPIQAQAELMAAVASQAQTEAEAEAMAGAATVGAIAPADRAALRTVLPHMVRGTAVLTRILRQRPVTKPAVRAVPTIARRTATVLTRKAAAGQPVTRKTAARVMANQTRKVLSSPRTCAAAIKKNVHATQKAKRATTVAARPRIRRPN
jgi:hypothetical protein